MLDLATTQELKEIGLNWHAVLVLLRLYHYLPPTATNEEILRRCYVVYYSHEPAEGIVERALATLKGTKTIELPLWASRWLIAGARRPQPPVAHVE